MTEVTADPVRRVLRGLTHGVYVVGVNATGMDDYLVVSLVMQCSVDPPNVAMAVAKGARIEHVLQSRNGCTLSILANDQLAAVKRYGAPGGVKRVPSAPERSARDRHPIPPESSGWLALRLEQTIDAGDHIVYVARVIEAGGMIAEQQTSNQFAALTLRDSGLPYAG